MNGKQVRSFFCAALAVFMLAGAAAENGEATSIRDLFRLEKKAFSFRNGVEWGMNPQQVAAIENVPMEQRTSSDWAVMLTAEPVSVSRFTADLVYIFYQNALRMITYEFQTDCSTLNYQSLAGALSSLYGESKDANTVIIKSWMDRIYQNYYNQELMHDARVWTTEDGTTVYLYYFTGEMYAILYICPGSDSPGADYETNGL